MKKNRSIFLSWLRARWFPGVLLLFWAGVMLSTFWLYGVAPEAIAYTIALCLAGTLLAAAVDLLRFSARERHLRRFREDLPAVGWLPAPRTCLEEDYQAILKDLAAERQALIDTHDKALADLTVYYTHWVHQIKTPMAAMDLLLQSEEAPDKTALEGELFKISQYVDMVLQYLRLDRRENDLVLRRVSLDKVLRQSVRKFAKLFVGKKLRLEAAEIGEEVLSDEKWLSFLLEQMLSNAIKYTPTGGQITVAWEEETLTVSDTGIGIAPEDLPRVFDLGFTGANGRIDKKATGIGLYLSRKAADLLGHQLTLTSQVGQGTQAHLWLGRPDFAIE